VGIFEVFNGKLVIKKFHFSWSMALELIIVGFIAYTIHIQIYIGGREICRKRWGVGKN